MKSYHAKNFYVSDDGWYVVKFTGDNGLYRLWKTIAVHCECLDTAKGYEVHWISRNVVLRVTREVAREYEAKKTQFPIPGQEETLFHHVPVARFQFVSGDDGWLEKLNADRGWSLVQRD